MDSSIFVDYNRYGIDVITGNNFYNSYVMYGLSDEPIVEKNYWSNYTAKYPDANELNSSGIWDTPYVDDDPSDGIFSGIDNYPLVNPVTDFEIADFNNPISIPTPTPTPKYTLIVEPEPVFTPTNIIASISLITIVGLGILAYLKKHRK